MKYIRLKSLIDNVLSVKLNDKLYGSGHLELLIRGGFNGFRLQLTDGYTVHNIDHAKGYNELKEKIKKYKELAA